MSVKIYKEEYSRTVFVSHTAIGAVPLLSLKAIVTEDDKVSVINLAKQPDIISQSLDFYEISNLNYTEIIDENDSNYGIDASSTVNALNALFYNIGSPSAQTPNITSSTALTAANGTIINYFMEADYGVGYEWINLPSGLVVASENERNLLGIITSGAGVYDIGMRAVNYYGIDDKTLQITVTGTGFVNAKSIHMHNNDRLDATPAISNPLYRASNGAGAGDAWTIAFWFRGDINISADQTILFFGGSDLQNEGGVYVGYNGVNDSLDFRYGHTHNNLSGDFIRLQCPANSLSANTWKHVVVTYDGGTTGSSAGSINDYYGRFEIFINGVSQSTTKSNGNNGFSDGIVTDFFRLGKHGSVGSSSLRSCYIEEVALWGSDQTANVSAIYHGGTVHNLSDLATPPDHWWRMGDGDTFPVIQDNIGSLDFTMTNMVVADIVNIIP